MGNQRSTSLRYPGGARAAYGTAAYLLGYLLAYPLARGRVIDALASTTIEVADGTMTATELMAAHGVSLPGWQGVGWLFYNAHFVSIQLRAPATGPPIVEANALAAGGGLLYLVAAIPPLALAGAGAMVTRDAAVTRDLRFDFGSGGTRYALNGGLVTMLGYMPPAFLGTFVFTYGYVGAFGPDVLGGWVLAGGVYPFVFGAVGGYLGRRMAKGDGGPGADARKTGW